MQYCIYRNNISIGIKMVITILPNSDQKGNVFKRANDDRMLTIIRNTKFGLSFGLIPRLLLALVTNEVKR